MRKSLSAILLFIIIFNLCNCQKVYYSTSHIEKKEINITHKLKPKTEIQEVIEPFKKQLDAKMDKVLTYNPYKLVKGLNSNLSNLLADQLLEAGNEIFTKKYHKQIDASLLNAGGIRRTFTPGNITTGNIFELMPFENMAVVVKLSGKDFLKMIDFLKQNRVGHPISGFSFSLDGAELNLKLRGEPFNVNKSYWVITNDYLQKGGDEMYFFSKPEEMINLKVKLRDLFIKQFQKNDTLQVNTTPRYLP